MERRIWTAPQATVEQFVANEYVAACQDLVNEYYAFKCDATGGLGTVYQETNGEKGLQIGFGGDKRLSLASYHACGITHYVPVSEGDFVDGYYLTIRDALEGGDYVTPVVIWTDGGTNVHVTRNLPTEKDIVTGNKS